MRHLIFGFAVGVFLSLAFYLLGVNVELLPVLIFFNILFVSALFPLDGSLKRKTVLLFAGNFIGLAWNNIIHMFAFFAAEQFGGFFGTAYIILSPFLNLVWIVSFWSLSLTLISNSKNNKAGTHSAY